jgi:hypothetical protein
VTFQANGWAILLLVMLELVQRAGSGRRAGEVVGVEHLASDDRVVDHELVHQLA